MNSGVDDMSEAMKNITYKNDKDAILDMCLRNAVRYARGEIKYTTDLHAQLKYAYDNSNNNTRSVMKTIFDIVGLED